MRNGKIIKTHNYVTHLYIIIIIYILTFNIVISEDTDKVTQNRLPISSIVVQWLMPW